MHRRSSMKKNKKAENNILINIVELDEEFFDSIIYKNLCKRYKDEDDALGDNYSYGNNNWSIDE
jgi:hypothetical protein